MLPGWKPPGQLFIYLAATTIVVTTAIVTAAVTATVIACALIAEKQDDNKDYNPRAVVTVVK